MQIKYTQAEGEIWHTFETPLSPATIMVRVDHVGANQVLNGVVQIEALPIFHSILVDRYRWDCISRNWTFWEYNIKNEPSDTQHPWMDFLEARARCIMWMSKEGKSDLEIARELSMWDTTQVSLIRKGYNNK